MKANNFLIFFTLIVCLTSCIKEPVPCINDFPEVVEVFESVEFGAGCSENGFLYEWEFHELGFFGLPNTLDKEGQYVNHTWFFPGEYAIYLTVHSKKNKYERKTNTSITVIDVCYNCVKGQYQNFELCGSEFMSKYFFDEELKNFESDGYTCTKI